MKKKTVKRIVQNFTFSSEDIDAASDFIFETLNRFGLDRKDALRTRLSAEEVLLNWQSAAALQADPPHAGCVIEISRRFGRISLTLSTMGMPVNPLVPSEEDDKEDVEQYGTGNLGRAMLENLGLSLSWQYRSGCNIVSCSLKRKQKMSQLSQVLLAVTAALLFGWLGLLLPQHVQDTLLVTLLNPLFNTFLGTFSCIVGPLMFLSMVWGIINIGDTRQLGTIGKKLLSRFMVISAIVGIICAAVAIPFFHISLSGTQSGQAIMQSVVEMILDIIPGNVVEPFLTGNTLQILFMGAAVGIVMIMLHDRMQVLSSVVEQSNALVQVILSTISSLTPAFIFLSILRLILQGTLTESAAGLLRVILLSVILSAAEITIETLSLMKLGVSPIQAARKMGRPFLIALTTASSAAAFPAIFQCCEKDLGIDNKLSNFALPFGSVVFMPHAVNLFILVPLFTAQMYGVEITIGTLILCVLNAVILSVAAPPIPGGAISCYTLMFMQLGIPLEAISLAAAANVVLDFTATSGQLYDLMVQLIHGAGKLDMLDKSVLQKKK